MAVAVLISSDEIQFIKVFAEVSTSYGIFPVTDAHIDYVEPHIDSEFYSHWKDYLTYELKEVFCYDFDAYDKWLNDLKFEDIDPRDLAKFKLPDEKIVVEVDDIDNLAYSIFSTIRNFYKVAEDMDIKDPNIYYGYYLIPETKYLAMFVAEFKGADRKAYAKLKKAHIAYENMITATTAQFSKHSKLFSIISAGHSKNSDLYEYPDMNEDDLKELAEAKEKLKEVINYRIAEISIDNFRFKKAARTKPEDLLYDFLGKLYKKIPSENVINRDDGRIDLIFS